jgi:hypothetical protein
MVRVASDRCHSPQHTKTSRHTQPEFTGTRHHHSPIQIYSKLCRSLQSQIRNSHKGNPLSSLRWARNQGRRKAGTVYRVRLTSSELNDSRQAW